MIYIVFTLIVAACVFYLFIAETRVERTPRTDVRTRSQLNERQESLRASLRDIEYEKSLGRIDAQNYERLQTEYLVEWDCIEKEIAALPTENVALTQIDCCPQCGVKLVVSTARFCHACGTKLPSLLFAVALVVTFFHSSISALDIRVTVQNGTTQKIQMQPLGVNILKLEQGMQPIASKESRAGKVTFAALPEMQAGPYMVQTVYQGVTYSRVIPPNVASPADVVLEVFESTTSVEKLRVRTLVEVRRVEKNSLAGLMILFFMNNDKRTFTGGPQGVEFALPQGAQIEQASASVGSGNSNIQWLKLNPQAGARTGVFSTGQHIKPGERIVQVMFRMPYQEAGTALDFQTLYPHDTGLQLIAEPENMSVQRGGKDLQRVRDESLGRSLIAFGAREASVKLSLSGGGIAEAAKDEVEIEIHSPLALWQKLIFPLIAVLLFAGAAYWRGRLQKSHS